MDFCISNKKAYIFWQSVNTVTIHHKFLTLTTFITHNDKESLLAMSEIKQRKKLYHFFPALIRLAALKYHWIVTG